MMMVPAGAAAATDGGGSPGATSSSEDIDTSSALGASGPGIGVGVSIGAGGRGSSSGSGGGGVREQDRLMPIANVIRIMRRVLPAHAKISDDAKETIQECVSEFISFITSEANDKCQREQRKTITAEDVLWAMSKLGFDDYVDPLAIFLHRYRDLEGDHRGSIRGDPLPPKTTACSSSTKELLSAGGAAGGAGMLYGAGAGAPPGGGDGGYSSYQDAGLAYIPDAYYK